MEDTKNQVRLQEIAQVALTVDDLIKAKEFYRDVLGMNPLFDTGTMSFFQCGNIRVMLGTSEQSAGSNGTILYFRVPEVRQAHEILKGIGVAFVQEPHLVARMKSHDLWLAFLKDPSGNTLGLMSEESRASETQQGI